MSFTNAHHYRAAHAFGVGRYLELVPARALPACVESASFQVLESFPRRANDHHNVTLNLRVKSDLTYCASKKRFLPCPLYPAFPFGVCFKRLHEEFERWIKVQIVRIG